MLAGSMKLKHFLLLALAGLGVLGAGAAFLFVGAVHRAGEVASPPEPLSHAPNVSPPSAGGATTSVNASRARPSDAVLLGHFKDAIPVDKVKDISPDQPYKLNLYKDLGHDTVNRLKLDLDRDDKWDEKLTADNGVYTRDVAPADDEEYTQHYRWDGTQWVGEGGAAAPTTPVAANAPVAAGREVDTIVLSYKGKDIGSEKLKDVTPGKPYKVNVYQDAGQATANRAKIDLDRDDKWDEKITFAPDGISREVAPADDEAYSDTYTWDGKSWSKAP